MQEGNALKSGQKFQKLCSEICALGQGCRHQVEAGSGMPDWLSRSCVNEEDLRACRGRKNPEDRAGLRLHGREGSRRDLRTGGGAWRGDVCTGGGRASGGGWGPRLMEGGTGGDRWVQGTTWVWNRGYHPVRKPRLRRSAPEKVRLAGGGRSAARVDGSFLDLKRARATMDLKRERATRLGVLPAVEGKAAEVRSVGVDDTLGEIRRLVGEIRLAGGGDEDGEEIKAVVTVGDGVCRR